MEEKIYKASRVSEGNRIFPAEIHIEDTEIMLKIPGFFSGKSRHIVYQQIEGVNIDTPIIGYSTITFVVGGEEVVAHGFSKSEVNEIKQICTAKIAASRMLSQSGNNNTQISVADELKKLKELLDAGVLSQEAFNQQKMKLLNK